jgi:hypothetical protein
MKTKAYSIGKSIILPHVRWVILDSRTGCMMFHSKVVRNSGKYETVGCDKMDSSGFCLGHEMSMEEFMKKYCSGIEAEIEEVAA